MSDSKTSLDTISTAARIVADLITANDFSAAELKTIAEAATNKKAKAAAATIAKFYLHGDDESNANQGETLGLTEEQIDNFVGTGYEVEFDIVIDEEGFAKATHVNGMALVEPVDL